MPQIQGSIPHGDPIAVPSAVIINLKMSKIDPNTLFGEHGFPPNYNAANPRETEKERLMRIQKDKMQAQFEAVPYLIFVFVFQGVASFVQAVLFFSHRDVYEYEEKVIGVFMIVMFYFFYLSGLVKFVKSFYEIMKTSKIDDSDLKQEEVYINVGVATVFLIYGVCYAFFSKEGQPKKLYGYIVMGISALLYLQSYLVHKFYVVA